MEGIFRTIALGIWLAWPVIPLYWLPVRLFPRSPGRPGRVYLARTVLLWLFVAAGIWDLRGPLLEYRFRMSFPLSLLGGLLVVAGLVLQAWTALVLGRRITGLPELDNEPAGLETRPPFNYCRHPTYLAHLLIFGGAALLTGYLSLFVLAAVDFLVSRFVIIPLEEGELQRRFGTGYEEYKRKIPCFLPRLFPRNRE